MGSEAFRLLQAGSAPSADMSQAMAEICDLALSRNVCIMPSAEPQSANKAVDDWNIHLARKYNKDSTLLIYNTYQCYLKSTPATLARHLRIARESGFGLGIKLVRGAYLHSEPRHLIWDTKSETDEVYDKLAEAVLKQRYNDILGGAASDDGGFPIVGLNLATHNHASVRKTMKSRAKQIESAETLVSLQYAQLQGMADDLGCEILGEIAREVDVGNVAPRVLKFISWGSMKDCLHYLLRRAAENKDAMVRTLATRNVMRNELKRRLFAVITGT